MPRVPLTILELRLLRHIQVCLEEQESWASSAPPEAWWQEDEEDDPNASLGIRVGSSFNQKKSSRLDQQALPPASSCVGSV